MAFDDYHILHKFNQYQTRVPTGYRDGGQWSSTGSSREGPSAYRLHSINRVKKPKPIKKPKPLPRLPSGKPVTPRFQKPIKVTQAELDRLQAIDKPLERVYPVEALVVGFSTQAAARAAARAAANQVTAAFRAMRLAIQAERVRRLEVIAREALRQRHATEWRNGIHHSPAQWQNRYAKGGWDSANITRTIKEGSRHPAPNYVNKGNTATRYEDPTANRYVVIDDDTNEILQTSGYGFDRPMLK